MQSLPNEPLVFYFTDLGASLIGLAFGLFFMWLAVCVCATATRKDTQHAKVEGEVSESSGKQ